MWPIQTQDKLFHDGNGTTELGTVVTAEWLNDVQQALLMVLAAGGQTPAKGKHNLLRDAIQRIVNNHTPAASATVAGVVKLNDTLSSQSTTEALTANQGKALADMIGDLGTPFQARGELGERNLDDITGSNAANYGLWYQHKNSNATQERGYPSSKAGAMLMLPAAFHGMQIYIPFDENIIFKRTTGGESQNYKYQPWQELGSAKSNVSVLTGTIADGGTIPLPAGFTAAQCKWFVSMASDNPSLKSWDIDENLSRVNYRFECTASAARVVNARMYWEGQGGSSGSVPSTANYLVIAYK